MGPAHAWDTWDAGHGTCVALVPTAFLTLSCAGCDVQDPCLCAHGVMAACNTPGTRIPPAQLAAACSSRLGKGSLALAPRQRCRAVAGMGSPGTAALPWHSAGSGWSLPGSAQRPGRSQRSAGTKGSFSCRHSAGGGEGRAGAGRGGAGQRMEWGVASFPARLCPGSLPVAAHPSPSRVRLPVAGLPWAGVAWCPPSPCRPGTSSCWCQSLCLNLLWKSMVGWIWQAEGSLPG